MLNEFKVGHYTDIIGATGCTVIIPPEKNMSSAAARGASPGSREYALLSPKRKIGQLNALVLAGGSAFGLNCAHGVTEMLAKQGIGYHTNYGVVPIIPSAVIYDKNIGDASVYPTAQNAVEAVNNAVFNNNKMGNVGAGTGATIGKWRGMDHAIKGGIGIADKEYGKAKVTALTVVNAVGDVIDKDGCILAGAAAQDGTFLGKDDPFSRWDEKRVGLAENTVLTAVMTNVILSKQQAHFIAERAHHGIARRIEPSHTGYDGDISFTISSLQIEAKVDLLAMLVVAAVEDSIISGIKNAESLCGVRAWKDL